MDPYVDTEAAIDFPIQPVSLQRGCYYEIFRNAREAMLVVDKAVILDCNLRALNLLRARRDQLLGRSLAELYSFPRSDGHDSSDPASEYARRDAAGERRRNQWSFLRADGTSLDAMVTLSRIGDPGNACQLAILRPLPDHEAESEVLLREQAAHLESVNSELDSIYFAVSHDLRAAIRGIAACTRIVIDDHGASLGEEVKRWLAHIHDDSQQLDRCTEALLELSLISRAVLNPAVLDLTAMARRIIESLTASAPARAVQFHIREGMVARADELLIRTLLRNLLENAWKFTIKTPAATIEFGSLESDPDQHVFFVRDNGAGFNMADEDRLFVPFQRVHSDEAFAGIGVGLAIVRRIAHRHGGKAWAVGEPGVGATFLFTLGRRAV